MHKSTLKKILVSKGFILILIAAAVFLHLSDSAEAFQSEINNAKGTGMLTIMQRWNNKYQHQSGTDNAGEAKEVLGYYTKDGAADNLSQNSLKNNAEHIDSIATFSYKVSPSGQLKGETPKEALKTAWSKDIEVYALIHNLNSSGFDRNLIHSILSSEQLREKTIENIQELVLKNGFDGVNIDFENVPAEDSHLLNKFMDELYKKFKAKGLKVTISVPAKTSDSNKGWGGAFDYPYLSNVTDKIMLMTYDEHWIGGAPGPVASKPWVEKVITYSTQVIPGEKLLLGIGNYGYDWEIGFRGYQTVPSSKAISLAQKYGAQILWHDLFQVPYFYYWKNGQKHVVWFESAHSAAFKMNMVNQYGLKGIAIWRLGFESSDFWTMVNKKLK